jgi:spore coat polysaccharide biosynthesis protein SpsF (cytidylyltransferase family)
VDTPEDLAFARKIYDYFGDDGFSWKQVLEVLRLNPQWADINRHIRQKEV